MSMDELLIEIQKLPLEEQRKLLAELSHNLAEVSEEAPGMSDEEFEQMLLAKGIISEIPKGFDGEEEYFEPIEVRGKPLSETVIEEKR